MLLNAWTVILCFSWVNHSLLVGPYSVCTNEKQMPLPPDQWSTEHGQQRAGWLSVPLPGTRGILPMAQCSSLCVDTFRFHSLSPNTLTTMTEPKRWRELDFWGVLEGLFWCLPVSVQIPVSSSMYLALNFYSIFHQMIGGGGRQQKKRNTACYEETLKVFRQHWS